MKEKYKILIVDDEQSILDMLKLQLEFEGYAVYVASNAKEALDKLACSPDIILLDINMAGMNGLDLCVSIRDFISCPIIFLTARVSEQDKINGLILRREQRSHNKTKSKFSEELVIDYSDRSLYIKGNKIELSNKEFEIIQLLSSNAGQVFDREKIYECIWGIDGNGDSVVIKEHIRKIRLKFSEFTDKVYIITVWGVGYKWEK